MSILRKDSAVFGFKELSGSFGPQVSAFFSRVVGGLKERTRLGWILFLAGLAAFLMLLTISVKAFAPVGKEPVFHSVQVGIPKGASTREIIKILQGRGIPVNTLVFRFASKVSLSDGRLQAGQYLFSPHQSTAQIISQLKRGGVTAVYVTIPEGFTAKQIAARLAANGLANEKVFLSMVEKPASVFGDAIPAPLAKVASLEGFLFPDTYQFTQDLGEAGIIKTMVNRFLEVAWPYYEQSALRKRFSLRQMVVLASIVEGEAQVEADRPIIAGVFINRLNKGMKLQSCATVNYVLGRKTRRLYEKDLQVESPYNTYKYYGLPPGPIGNPGLSSFIAAARPAKVDYLYFVAKPDGSHAFSRTFAEQLKNQRKYLR
ncbi:MAG: endolytic transglycosylase MltG [Syntrophothermus sp.]